MSDELTRAVRILIALGGDPSTARSMIIPGPPKAKQRPRVVRTNVYDPSLSDEKELARNLAGFEGRPLEGNLCLVALFFRPDNRRLDTDNLLKLIADAGNRAGLWHDDCQLTGMAGVQELDKANPRTVLVIGRHSSSLDRNIKPKPPKVERRRGPR